MYTKEEEEILTLITNFCKNECPSCQECPEDQCVLWNIEQVILKYSERRGNNPTLYTTQPIIDSDHEYKIPDYKPTSFHDFYCHGNPECSECNLEETLEILNAMSDTNNTDDDDIPEENYIYDIGDGR